MFPNIARAALLAIALLLILLGLAGLLLPLHLPLFGPLIFGVVLLVGALFERWRYKPVETRPAAGFEPTAERFLDPISRKPVRVYANARTGERRYVEDAGP